MITLRLVMLWIVRPMERVATQDHSHHAGATSAAEAHTVAVRVRLHRRGTVWPTKAPTYRKASPMVRGGGAHEQCRSLGTMTFPAGLAAEIGTSGLGSARRPSLAPGCAGGPGRHGL